MAFSSEFRDTTRRQSRKAGRHVTTIARNSKCSLFMKKWKSHFDHNLLQQPGV